MLPESKTHETTALAEISRSVIIRSTTIEARWMFCDHTCQMVSMHATSASRPPSCTRAASGP